MNGLQTYLPTVGRILIAIIFILSGFNKITGMEGTVGYMEAYGLPGVLIWPTIVVELGGGLLLLVGYQTRLAAAALAAFTLASGIIFHSNFADQMQMINFLKNLAITGGALYVVAYGAGALSVDDRKATA
ncbi:DoxX family protein [Pelagibacterium halotolerans]|uniref:DoxX family protein n=1 Tax=Pelagibacterium halotolerans TaxID=531813 RepID=UPI00384CEB05